jgi:hypothetical protein
MAVVAMVGIAPLYVNFEVGRLQAVPLPRESISLMSRLSNWAPDFDIVIVSYDVVKILSFAG